MNKEPDALRRHWHLGAYGVCVEGDTVLLIRKARGPYTGLLDLPGGGIEFGEEPEVALCREFREETGLLVSGHTLLRAASRQIRHRPDDGVEELLHHIGLLYAVTLGSETRGNPPQPDPLPDGQDSLGAAWFRREELTETLLTPFARVALFGEGESVG